MTKTVIPEAHRRKMQGRQVMAWDIVCSGCTELVRIKRPDYMRLGTDAIAASEAVIVKALDGFGWTYKKHLRQIKCVKCKKEEKQVRSVMNKVTPPKAIASCQKTKAPREASREAKRRIADLLESVYMIDKNMYSGNESDQSVADTLKHPRAWVTDVRIQMYGDGEGNENSNKKNNALDLLETKLNDIGFSFDLQIAEIRTEIEKLRT